MKLNGKSFGYSEQNEKLRATHITGDPKTASVHSEKNVHHQATNYENTKRLV